MYSKQFILNLLIMEKKEQMIIQINRTLMWNNWWGYKLSLLKNKNAVRKAYPEMSEPLHLPCKATSCNRNSGKHDPRCLNGRTLWRTQRKKTFLWDQMPCHKLKGGLVFSHKIDPCSLLTQVSGPEKLPFSTQIPLVWEMQLNQPPRYPYLHSICLFKNHLII